MKRIICLMLVLAFLLLSGCHYSDSGDILEPVTFYYPRATDHFVYGAEDGVLAGEVREGSGHVGDLNYLITMYLRGPQDTTLRSPFPAGCKLEEVRSGGNTLCIVLGSEFTALENTELTLACAALAKTCLALSHTQRVRIDSSSDEKTFTVTLTEDSLLLADYSAFEAAPAEESE